MMETPKEKAISLTLKFYSEFSGIDGIFLKDKYYLITTDRHVQNSIKSAMICAKEIFSSHCLPTMDFPDKIISRFKEGEKLIGGKKYWQDVIQEIYNLNKETAIEKQ